MLPGEILQPMSVTSSMYSDTVIRVENNGPPWFRPTLNISSGDDSFVNITHTIEPFSADGAGTPL